MSSSRTPAPPGELLRFYREVVVPYDGAECLTWPYSLSGNGRGQMKIKGKKRLVHRILCEEIHGPPPTPEHVAAHSCGKGHEACVAKAHVRWATQVENFQDAVEHGTSLAKLTEDDVRRIRQLKNYLPQPVVAARFGVSIVCVSLIQNRKTWKWVA